MLDRYPELYSLGQRNAFVSLLSDSRFCASCSRGPQFTVRIFWQWVANAVYHSLLIFIFTILIFQGDIILPGGYIGAHWVWGTTVYMVVMATVLGKAALISEYVVRYLR